MRKFGLIGYPLTHSFSKKYFTEKFQREGITDCVYENFPIPSIEELGKILSGTPGLEGLNVTIPYKQQVIAWLDHHKDTLPIPACNCIRIRNGETTGYNTDIFGFEQSLRTGLRPYHQRALILGNGGATEAVRYVLARLGIGFSIVSRRLHNGSTMVYEDVSEEVVREHLLIINASPVGMYPHTEQYPVIPYQAIGPRHYLYDLIYNPVKTILLQKGEEQGATIRNGADMLVLQAEESWRIWNN